MSKSTWATMMGLWWQYLLDFLAVSMVIPTMGQYLTSAGGSASYYYIVLVATTAVQLAGNLAVGTLVDMTGKVRELMLPLCICGVLGHSLYVVADAVEALRTKEVILVARLLVGLATTKAVLVLVVMARVVKEEHDRNRWVVQLATARSLGLFVGPAVAVVLVSMTGGIENDHGGSIFGAYASPGLFLAIGNALTGIWVNITLRDLPPPEAGRTGANRPKSGALGRFFRKKAVMVSVLTCCFGLGTGLTVEYAVPVTTAAVLDWNTVGTSSVLIGISIAVMINQANLLALQSIDNQSCRSILKDINITMFGSLGVLMTMIFSLLLWSEYMPTGVGAVAGAKKYWKLCMGPFIITEFWLPFLGNGTNMVFTRLSLTYVPQFVGICQALVVTNGPIFGQMVLVAWLGFSYSGDEITLQGPPKTAFAGLAFFQTLIMVGSITCYKSLAPRDIDMDTSSPMRSIASSRAWAGVPVNGQEAAEVDAFQVRTGTTPHKPLLGTESLD